MNESEIVLDQSTSNNFFDKVLQSKQVLQAASTNFCRNVLLDESSTFYGKDIVTNFVGTKYNKNNKSDSSLS